MNALADAFDVEAALFGFQGHARVEIGAMMAVSVSLASRMFDLMGLC